jgi:hypothetical protein
VDLRLHESISASGIVKGEAIEMKSMGCFLAAPSPMNLKGFYAQIQPLSVLFVLDFCGEVLPALDAQGGGPLAGGNGGFLPIGRVQCHNAGRIAILSIEHAMVKGV